VSFPGNAVGVQGLAGRRGWGNPACREARLGLHCLQTVVAKSDCVGEARQVRADA